MVPRSSCLHCRSLRLASVEFQPLTGTGCPFLAGGGLQFWLCLLLPAVMVSRAQCTGRAGPPSPACLGPIQVQPSLTAAGRLLLCTERSPVKLSAGMSPSQNYFQVHHDDSGFQSPSTSNCWQPEVPSRRRKVLLKVCQYPVTCNSLGQ